MGLAVLRTSFLCFAVYLLFVCKQCQCTCFFNPCDFEGICKEGETCYLKTNTCQPVCVNDSLSTSKDGITSTTSNVSVVTPSGRTYDVCSESYVLRPISERTCLPGFECHYGVCQQGGLGFSCLCDPGSAGTVCQNKCCKQCGDHGTCDVLLDGELVCVCDQDYSGEFCNIRNSGSAGTTHFVQF